jgi:hypothetical protein
MSTVDQLTASQPAQATGEGAQDFAAKESDFQINSALKSLMAALQSDKSVAESEVDEKPRRVLLCLGQKTDETARLLAKAGYKVYVAQTPAQANERLRA